MRVVLLGPLLVGLLLSSARADQPAILERFIVIDISGSMSGDPLGEVRSELTKLLQAQPASTAAPVTFLTFSDDAHPAQQFTQQQDAVHFVESLRSDHGGTRIAAGLEAAIDQLRQGSSLNNVTLMLYTDDQDPDRAAIQRAEQALDKLFSERTERGLAQAVYIRSWSSGGALGDLAVELAKNPNVTVVDSSTPLTVVPVTIRPAVRVDHAELEEDGVHLDVQFRAACWLNGAPQGFAAAPVTFRSLHLSSDRSDQWDITPGALAKSCRLQLEPSEQEFTAGVIQLHFRVTPASAATPPAGGQHLLPLLQQSELVVPVPFVAERTFELAGQITSASDPQWDPTDLHRAIYKIDVLVGVRPVGKLQAKPPITLGIRGADGCQLVSGPKSVTLVDKRAETVSVEMAVPVPKQVVRSGQGEIRATIEVFSGNGNRRIAFLKPLVRVTSGPLSSPPSATAQIDVSVRSVSPALWYAPPDTSVFRVVLDVSVAGPLPKDAKIIFVAPPQVSQSRITPATVHTGRQTVCVDVAARLKPSPEATELVFGLQPPPPTPIVRTTCPEQLKLKVVAPSPVHLLVQGRRTLLGDTDVPAPMMAHSADIPLRVGLAGPVARRFAEQLKIAVNGSKQLRSADPVLLPYQWETVPVALSDQQQASYFWDRVDVVHLQLAPSPAAAAVLPADYECRVVRQAPFKRQLFVVLSCIALLATPCLLASLAQRLRSGTLQEVSLLLDQTSPTHEATEEGPWIT